MDGLSGSLGALQSRVRRSGAGACSSRPFAETKEQIAGYDVIDCTDLDEAIEIASKHPTAWWGTIEVRPIAGNHWGDAALD